MGVAGTLLLEDREGSEYIKVLHCISAFVADPGKVVPFPAIEKRAVAVVRPA